MVLHFRTKDTVNVGRPTELGPEEELSQYIEHMPDRNKYPFVTQDDTTDVEWTDGRLLLSPSPLNDYVNSFY